MTHQELIAAPKLTECSAYDSAARTCGSGFFKLTGVCFGIGSNLPPCLDMKWQEAMSERFERAGAIPPWEPAALKARAQTGGGK